MVRDYKGADNKSKLHGVYNALYKLRCRPGVKVTMCPGADVL